MSFPVAPATGKGGKVSINVGDGAYLSNTAMTLNASYTFKGETYTNRVYTLGTGKTLLNMRPAVEPDITVDGITSEVILEPGSAVETVSVDSFTMQVTGTAITVSAQVGISFTRGASGESRWVAVHVHKSTKAISCTEGTVISGAVTALLDTYGSSAGQRPLIATTELLIGWIKADASSAIPASSDFVYNDQERADSVGWIMAPNIGGIVLSAALPQIHAGPTARPVYFSGHYLDDAFVDIGTAKEWSLTPSTSQVSETFLGGAASQTVIGSWAFTFTQLATDQHVKNSMLNRQGFMAVRLTYPNGGYWQGVGSGAGSFKCSPSAFNSIDVSGSLSDDPVFV